MMHDVTFTDLGYANGWRETPAIVEECREKGHKLTGGSYGRCLHKYVCEECRYIYRVDSSG